MVEKAGKDNLSNIKNSFVEYVNFSFPYSFPVSDEFKNTIRGIKNEYELKMNLLKNERDLLASVFSIENTISLIGRHKSLVNWVLFKIISLFEPLLKGRRVGIFWNGSFARNSNSLLSDYDLNFIYSKDLRSVVLPIEEQICLLLADIVGQKRDLVHGAIACHLPLLDGLKLPENFKKMIFCIHYQEGGLDAFREYDISSGLEGLMFRMYWVDRDPKKLLEFLLESVDFDKCYHWVMNYEIAYDHDVMTSIFEKVIAKEIKLKDDNNFIESFNELIENCRGEVATLTRGLLDIDLTKVRYIKERYKKNPFKEMFNVLALIRRRLIFDGIDIGVIRIDQYAKNGEIKNLLGEKLTDALFYQIFHYIWAIMRLEVIFEKKEIRFGAHSKERIDDSFIELYKNNYSEVKDFFSYHNNLLRQMSDVLNKTLDVIRININGERVIE